MSAPEANRIQSGQPRKEERPMMKLTLLGACLVFGLAGPAIAAELSPQDRAAVDLTEQKYVDTYNAKNSAAWAEFFTADAIRVAPDGIARGRDAIRKQVEAEFKAGASGQASKTIFAVMSGNVVVAGGEWSAKFGNQTLRGYWSNNLMHEGEGLKISLETYNVTEPASDAQK
jgi:ketosteroid isomerase-like protein